MEVENQTIPSHNNFETLMSDSYFSKEFDCDKDLKEKTSTFLNHYRSPGLCIKDEEDEDSEDHVLCILGPRLEPTGFSQEYFKRFVIIRPSYTLGGTGGGIAYNTEEFETIRKSGLDASSTSQVLVEKYRLGWEECGLGVMGDLADNVVITSSIENIDPMGVHTEDSITVAPAQTLTNKEYHRLREIGVECGGSKIQFAVNPVDGEVMVVEMNPRVSRSSALASKATGFPIAKMAAKLSVGYTLDQFPNDIKKKTPASFEPSIDYVVPKISRFAYKRVDTCAAEFEANTPYMYSCYDNESESLPTKRKKVLILGGGPNRIGQGIKFDYCCCHTSFALQEAGFETIMMNSNPETMSTDYDTSVRLYFEPLTVEDVFIDLERPDGIVVQFGGQTPLKLALPIEQYLNEHKLLAASGAGYVRIWGTSPDSIDAAEDREWFNAFLNELKIEQPKGGIAKSGADVERCNLIRTDESIINGGDLHFAEIIYTNGPKGMRVFNVFLQGEKVLAELDIYSAVGANKPLQLLDANKPLQLLDARVSVGEVGKIALSFEGVHGSPVVSRICIRRAPKPPDPLIEPEYLTCNNCATEIPLAQGKIKTMKREQSHIGVPPAGGLIDLHSMSKKKKRKIEQKHVLAHLMIFLSSFPPRGGPSFAAMAGRDASTRNSVGHPPGKKRGDSLTGGGGNKSDISLRSLKYRFNQKKPALDSMVIAYQYVRGCFLGNEVRRWKIICNQVPQDWMLHGLWPPEDEDDCHDLFDEEKIRRNQEFLDDLLQNWASLECDDVEGHIRFWKRQWTKHGVKSRLSQKLYMKLALYLHDQYKGLLTKAMNSVKTPAATFDSALGTNVFTINTSAFNRAVTTRLAVPKLTWIKLGNKCILKEVQLKVSLSSDAYEIHDMDNRGETLPVELIV